MESRKTQLQIQIAALRQEQNAVKQQQNDLNIQSMEGVNKLVAKEMIVNQDSHFKNEISKLESMVASNDFGQMYVQKNNSTNTTSATVPVAAPQISKPVAKPAAPVKAVPDAAAVVAANEAALEANAQKEEAPKKTEKQQKTNPDDISIETSKLDDTNFDNLGQSIDKDSGKSKDEIKKEVKSMAEQISKKDADEKKQVAEDQ